MLELLSPTVLTILITFAKVIAIVFAFALGVSALMTLLGDRKQSSKIQNRVGPNRAMLFGLPFTRFLGIPHFIADGIKMILKENIVPDDAHKYLHLIGPALVFFPSLIGWVGMPFMDFYCSGTIEVTATYQEVCLPGPDGEMGVWHNYFQIMNFNAGLLFAFAIAAISVYGAAIAGWASNSKFSLLGGLRSTAQMISYEVSMGLSIAGLLMIYGTLDMNEMARIQGYLIGGWLPMWGIVVQPLGFILFFLAGMAETKRAPFDVPEGESEIVAGYATEYSSMKFGIMQLGEYIAVTFISAMIALLFLGGWQIPWLFGDGFHLPGFDIIHVPYWAIILLRIGAMATKIIFLVWIQFMLRWTLPRFRYDQIMVLGWKIILPLSLANLVVTAFIAALL